ncbi:MAG: response regulator transcription factor [Spirochaetia bacterium]|nr:response regulator transcription factor [Spirochaetia bacterium]
MKPKKIFLVDDHLILREGLKHILSETDLYEVSGESGDGREALEKIEKMKPDIVILDISLPSLSGIEIARQVRKFHKEIKIIMLSQYDNEEYIDELLKYGIHGYMLKDSAADDLLKAISEVLKGNIYLSGQVTKKLVQDFLPKPSVEIASDSPDKKEKSIFSILSAREREILKLIAEGYSNDKIASSLWISPKTVKTHRANIMKKLNLSSMAELVKYAVKHGIVEA